MSPERLLCRFQSPHHLILCSFWATHCTSGYFYLIQDTNQGVWFTKIITIKFDQTRSAIAPGIHINSDFRHLNFPIFYQTSIS